MTETVYLIQYNWFQRDNNGDMVLNSRIKEGEAVYMDPDLAVPHVDGLNEDLALEAYANYVDDTWRYNQQLTEQYRLRDEANKRKDFAFLAEQGQLPARHAKPMRLEVFRSTTYKKDSYYDITAVRPIH